MTRPLSIPPGATGPAWAPALPSGLRRIWNPALYQGGGARDGYFEGWYFKCVDSRGAHPIALIPGVSHDRSGGTTHAFVQAVRPGGHTVYLEYPAGDFVSDPRRFEIRVGPNIFSSEGITLDIDRDGLRLRAELRFGPWNAWPVSLAVPGIMGPYRFVPRMECYHGVLSMDHTASGALAFGDETLSFDGGRGYIEKDWGRSFPSSWVWAQSNHFGSPGTSVTVSVAKIPWMGSSFVGCIAGVLLDGRLYRFTTYTGAKLTCYERRAGGANVTFADRDFELRVELAGAVPAALKAPRHGRMIARADESLDATLGAILRTGDGEVLLDGIGMHAGVEVMDADGELSAGVEAS
jgi:tocopherol cyclase